MLIKIKKKIKGKKKLTGVFIIGRHVLGEIVTTKGSKKLGFLSRNIKGCPPDLKKTAYLAIVSSSLEYAAPIWDPHQANNKA